MLCEDVHLPSNDDDDAKGVPCYVIIIGAVGLVYSKCDALCA